MQAVSYTRGSDIYEVKPITDIACMGQDMASVSDVIQDTDPDYYKANMLDSVAQGLAYDIWKNGERVGFVYNKIENDQYYGCSIKIWDHIGMLIGLKHMFDICDKHKISFAPHENNLKDFISMAAGASIRLWHTTDTSTVFILRDEIYPRGERIMKYLGVTNG